MRSLSDGETSLLYYGPTSTHTRLFCLAYVAEAVVPIEVMVHLACRALESELPNSTRRI